MQRTRPPTSPHPSPSARPSHEPWDLDDPVIGSVGHGAHPSGSLRWDADATAEADALAELFLGGSLGPSSPGIDPRARTSIHGRAGDEPEVPDPAEQSDPGQTARTWIEAIILGHLPILGSAWVAGYAGALAERLESPVGLVKVRGGYLSIEVFGLALGRASPESDLADALAPLIGRGVRWLVCTDTADEPALIYGCRPDGVTMLTAAEDAAVVGSYRAIKELLEHDPALSAGMGWPENAEVTIALAGASPQRASAAGDKLRSAVRTFLGREVHVAVCPQRIGPRPSECIFRGCWDQGAQELVSQLRKAAAPRASAPASGRGAAAASEPPTTAPARKAPPQTSYAPQVSSHPLTTLIGGLTPLNAVCPYAPEVELAWGDHGDLHLVCSPDSLSSLTTASAWARAHAGLLLAACAGMGGCVKPGNLEITCHVLSENATRVRRLIETDLRVHLVVRGEADGRPYAVTRVLN